MNKLSLACAVAAGLFLVGCASIEPPSVTGEPGFGEEDIDENSPEHQRFSVVAGGPNPARAALGFACTGWIAEAPDFRFNFTAEGPLRFEVRSSSDTTLAISGPDGQWRCNDDGAVGLNPVITYTAPQAGEYNVFVGTFFRSSVARASLYVSHGDSANESVGSLDLPASGTGFFISTEGHLVTSAHLVETRDNIEVQLGEERIPAEIVSIDKDNDVALLKIDAQTQPLAIASAEDARRGSDVFVLGYPLSSIQGDAQRASFGRINALAGLGDDERFIQMDVPILPGNSGGPLVNEDGVVIGIVAARLNVFTVLREAGTIPEGVGFAVKSDYLLDLIGEDVATTGVPLEGSLADMVEAAESSVVQIFVE